MTRAMGTDTTPRTGTRICRSSSITSIHPSNVDAGSSASGVLVTEVCSSPGCSARTQFTARSTARCTLGALLPRHQPRRGEHVVLLISSLTAAWPFAARSSRQEGVIINIVSPSCAPARSWWSNTSSTTHKFHDGTGVGRPRREAVFGLKFDPHPEVWQLPRFQKKHPEAAKLAEQMRKASGAADPNAASNKVPSGQVPAGGAEKPAQVPAQPAAVGTVNTPTPGAAPPQGSQGTDHPAAMGTANLPSATAGAAASERREVAPEAWPLQQAGLITDNGELLKHRPAARLLQHFFMTLHVFHLLAGSSSGSCC